MKFYALFLLTFASLATQAQSLSVQVQQIVNEFRGAREQASQFDELHFMTNGTSSTLSKLNQLAAAEGAQNICPILKALDVETLTEINLIVTKLDKNTWPCARELEVRVDNAYMIEQNVALNDSGNESGEELLTPAFFGRGKKQQPPQSSRKGSKPSRGGTSEIVVDSGRGGKSLPFQMQLPPGYLNLTFDDGPHASRTNNVLRILQDEGILANFFVLGENAAPNARILQSIPRLGHSVGNHSYNHPDMRTLSYKNAVNNINAGFTAIANVLGYSDPFFRFPYGASTGSLVSYLHQQQVSEFFWNVDTLDWKHSNPNTLLAYALKQTRRTGRGIVLFHDIHPQTVSILPAYIRTLKSEGYKFVVFRPKVGQQLN